MVIEFSVRETAAMIREVVRERFPETRFRLRWRRSAAGTWVGLDWTDGPTEAAVERLIGRFEGRTIDGESIERLEIAPGGRIVRTRYAVDLLTVTRLYSAEALHYAIVSTRVDRHAVRIRRTGDLGSSDLEGSEEVRQVVYGYLQDVTRPERALRDGS